MEDSEAVGISNIISNLISTFPRVILTALPSELFTSFINCLTLLTCSFGRSAALEEVVSITPLTLQQEHYCKEHSGSMEKMFHVLLLH